MSNKPVKKKRKPVTRKDLRWDGNETLMPGDTGYFLRSAMEVWDLPDIDISDPEQIEVRILWYFQRCIDDDLKPTVNGLCNALGVERQTFYNWGVGDYRKDTHFDIVKKAKRIMGELWETFMVEGKINPTVGIFLGKNHFGYVDKKEVAVEPRKTVIEPEEMDDLLEIYEEEE